MADVTATQSRPIFRPRHQARTAAPEWPVGCLAPGIKFPGDPESTDDLRRAGPDESK